MIRLILAALMLQSFSACATSSLELSDDCASDACIYQTMVDRFNTMTATERDYVCDTTVVDYTRMPQSPECEEWRAARTK